jgi:hypothetical protein
VIEPFDGAAHERSIVCDQLPFHPPLRGVTERIKGSSSQVLQRGEDFEYAQNPASEGSLPRPTRGVAPGKQGRGEMEGQAEIPPELFGSGLTVSAFAKNALNRGYYTGGESFGVDFGLNDAAPAEPRTYGAELSYRF